MQLYLHGAVKIPLHVRVCIHVHVCTYMGYAFSLDTGIGGVCFMSLWPGNALGQTS